MKYFYFSLIIFFQFFELINANDFVLDEVICMIGDEAIFRSDLENIKLQMQAKNQKIDNDFYRIFFEKLAIQKLFLYQAKLDSVCVSELQIDQMVDSWMQYVINQIGSKKQVEEYFGKSISSLREWKKQEIKEQTMIQSLKRKLVDGFTVKPSEVREFYYLIPPDSLPSIPLTVELEIITLEPVIALNEVEYIKKKLIEFTELVNLEKREFSTLARLYSDDKESAKEGGELGFIGRGSLDPRFLSVAFELSDKKKVSRIVETEYGFHIIQLIEKKGSLVNVRHILLKPHHTSEELSETSRSLDSIRMEILNSKITFEKAAIFFSQDEETRNNRGLMINSKGSSHFELEELSTEIRQILIGMKTGDISNPFILINSKHREVSALIKLKSKVAEHKMTLYGDYQIVKEMLEQEKQNQIFQNFLDKKQQELYIRIHEDWKNYNFQNKGWRLI